MGLQPILPTDLCQILTPQLPRQMEVVRHLAIGGNSKIPNLHRLHQELKEALLDPLLQKNLLTPPTTVHHMVPGGDIRYVTVLPYAIIRRNRQKRQTET